MQKVARVELEMAARRKHMARVRPERMGMSRWTPTQTRQKERAMTVMVTLMATVCLERMGRVQLTASMKQVAMPTERRLSQIWTREHGREAECHWQTDHQPLITVT